MAPLWHRGDYPKVPKEDQLRDALRPLAIPQGEYMVPRAVSTEEMRSPGFLQKMKEGPVLILTVLQNEPMSMGQNLILWFLYTVVVSIFSAYVAGRTLAPATPYLRVFQIVGATAFIGYAVALWQMWIWYKRSLSITIKSTIDGLIYALLTAGTFGWLWPRAFA
jgi:hypothetical protein